jgi:plastocyanin
MKRPIIAAAAAAALAAAAIPAHAATKTVRVDDNVFAPKTLSVKRGDTVRFRWVGDAPHNVVVTRGPQRFRSSIMRSGSYRKRLRRRGTYTIVCTIHPGMTMKLRVR